MIQRVPAECPEVGVCVLFITSEGEAKEDWWNVLETSVSHSLLGEAKDIYF